MEDTPVLLRAMGSDGVCLFVNRRWCDFTGRSSRDELGGGWAEGVHADDRERCNQTYRRSASSGFEMEYRLRRRDGAYRWMLELGSPRAGSNGGFIVSCIDVTERRDAEDALIEAEECFRVLTDATPDLVFICRPDGALTYTNERWREYIGAADGAMPEVWQQSVTPADLPLVAERWRVATQGRAVFDSECRLRGAAGEDRWHLLHIAPQRLDRGSQAWVGFATDIHERKEAERGLVFSEKLYRSLAEAIPALVLMTSPEGELQYCNERLLNYCGRTMESLRGAAWVDLIHPDDAERGRARWSRRVSSGRPYSAEYRVRAADGTYRWHLGHTIPLRDDSGDLVGWLGATIDIDGRKLAEERQRELVVANQSLLMDVQSTAAELKRANAAKDEFLSMVSHELRTPITTIFGNADILRRNDGGLAPEVQSSAIADISQEAQRLQQIIDNMFVLARLEAGQGLAVEPVMIPRMVESLIAGQVKQHPERPVACVADATLAPASAEPTYTEQVLRNLLSNAEKYSPGGAPIEIHVSRDDGNILVRVLDRGRGIEEGESDQLFTAFYRSPPTSEFASGAGIGLAVCRRLIEAQGGHIWVAPREGGGTEAGFTLPVAEEAIQ